MREIEPPDWVIVETKASSEELTERQLRQAGYRSYLPRYRRLLLPHGRVAGVMRPLFPRLVFCQDWRGWPDMSITGALGLMPARPGIAKLSDADIALIMERERSGDYDTVAPRGNGKSLRDDIAIGDEVEFDAALGQRIMGVLAELSANGKAIVFAMIFDRMVRANIDAEMLHKVSDLTASR